MTYTRDPSVLQRGDARRCTWRVELDDDSNTALSSEFEQVSDVCLRVDVALGVGTLVAQVGERARFVGERLVVDDVEVKDVHLALSHGFLTMNIEQFRCGRSDVMTYQIHFEYVNRDEVTGCIE